MTSSLSGFPELLPAQRFVELAVLDQLRATLRAARVRLGRDPRRRAAGSAAAQGRDRQGGLRPAAAARRRRTTGDSGLGLHFDLTVPVRALRPRERRPPRVPVPALPDPEGVARRTAAGRSLPRVHPGRHRRRRPRRAALPPRRRGRAGDGRGARRARFLPAAAAADQQPQADRGFLRGLGAHRCPPP